tara:strand:- start:365 stop:607 length:243 start_codon:yes stop_codon:yes gene_type:complete
MIKLLMQKNYFHNDKSSNESKDKKKSYQIFKVDKKVTVDINILLNRVKVEGKNELKKKIILFSFITITLFLFGIFITSIN